MSEPRVEIQRIENVSALAAMSRVEIDGLVATAKQYPRSIERFSQAASAMTLSSVEFAAQSFYALPRAGKWIVGPSIRFAETLQHAWGNCRAAARVTEELDKHVVAQGVFIDCEANTMVSIEQKRRITDKDGNRYNADMILTTSNAACSIALRNAILRGIPKALWMPVYDKIEGVITEPGLLAQTREKALAYYQDKGFGPAKVCALVGVDGPDKIGPKEIFLLRGLRNSVEDGEISMEQAFRNSKPVATMPRERKQAPETKAAKGETRKPKAETKAAKSAPKASAAKKNELQEQVAKITEKQRVEMFRIYSAKEANFETVQRMVKSVLKSFGFADSHSVTVDKYDLICAALRGE